MAAERRIALGPGVELAATIARDGDPDRLLVRPDCHLVKLQRKVLVGRITAPAGVLYIKRYNVFSWRVALASWGRASPAFAAWGAVAELSRRGFGVPERLAAIEFRHWGFLRKSFLVTLEVPGALTVDQYWQGLLTSKDVAERQQTRRVFARGLGDLFRRLHAAGLYHNDLKDVNVLVRGSRSALEFVLLDLEQVRVLPRLSIRRRTKNLVQLARTLGQAASAADRWRFLTAYVGAETGPMRAARKAWALRVLRAQARKDRRRESAGRQPPTVACTVVCQNEQDWIARCLESVRWCDEIVVVDGGSTDATVAHAQAFAARVLTNPWPGYRAQKQFALDAARGDWVLNIDADERVTPELAAEIRAAVALAGEDVAGFAIPRLVSYLGRWWYRGGWYPRRIVRLVRRAKAEWGGRDPHERAVVHGRVLPLEHPIVHYTYVDIQDHLRTVDRLTAVAVQHLQGRSAGIGRLMLEPSWRFVRAYVLKRGALEGVPGLFVAATDAFYAFLRWARVWEAGSEAETRTS